MPGRQVGLGVLDRAFEDVEADCRFLSLLSKKYLVRTVDSQGTAISVKAVMTIRASGDISITVTV